MSESDSFINEVSEEVRRERLYGFLRRYGWALAALVALIVGGAAANEWRKARAQGAAEAAGDALRAAILEPDPVQRAARLEAIGVDGTGAVLAELARAGSLLGAGERDQAAAVLAQVADEPAAPEIYRELAALQRVMLLGPEMDLTERQATIQALATDDAPFRLMALEQRAMLSLEQGDLAAASADLETIMSDPGATPQMASRARQLIIATGGAIPDGMSPVMPADG